MPKCSRRFCSVFSIILILAVLISFAPVGVSHAAAIDPLSGLLPSLDTDKPIRDEEGPEKYYIFTPSGSMTHPDFTSRNVNAVVLDSETKKPLTGVGVYLYSPSSVNAFERYATTGDGSSAVFKDVPVNLIPSFLSNPKTSEHMFFGIGSVPEGYKHPKNAMLNMDLFVDTPAYDELRQFLIEEGFGKVGAELITQVVKHGTKILDFFLPIPISLIQNLVADTIMPEKFKTQFPDENTGKTLPADIRYMDYNFIRPLDTKYWIQVELERKTCDPITIIVPATLQNSKFVLTGPDGEEYPLTVTESTADEIHLCTGDNMPLGVYYLSIDEERSYPFWIEDVAFPTTADGRPDYQAFRNLSPMKQEILKDADAEFFDKYYPNNPGDLGKRVFHSEDNEWTMAIGEDEAYGGLHVENPLAVKGHVLRLSAPSELYWLTKAWYGEAPADGQEILMRVYMIDYDGRKHYLKDLLSDVSTPEYREYNAKLTPTADEARFDGEGNTLVCLSASAAACVTMLDDATLWEAPIALPQSFVEYAAVVGVEEVSGADGWTQTNASGTHYGTDLESLPSMTLINSKDSLTLQFRKVDMNGNPVDTVPTFEIRESLSTDASAQNTITYPVSRDNTGLYSVNLRKNAEVTLAETYPGRGYQGGAAWTVKVSSDGTITLEPQNTSTGNARLRDDGVWELTNLFTRPQAIYMTKLWTDLTGSSVTPPDEVAGISVHLEITDGNYGTLLDSADRILWKKNDWTDTWYFNYSTSGYGIAELTEMGWVDADGNPINPNPAWKQAHSQSKVTLGDFMTGASLELRNYISTIGLLKVEGTESSTEYSFVREWDNGKIVWDDTLQCYPLDMSGYDTDSNQPYVLDEYDKNGTQVGKWELHFVNGTVGDVKPVDFTKADGQTEAFAQVTDTTDGNTRLVLYNPTSSYTVKLQKQWDPDFVVYDPTGRAEDHRPHKLTFTLTPVGIGHTLENMKPIPSDSLLPTITLKLDRDNPKTQVTLPENVIYLLTEEDDGSSVNAYYYDSTPFYSVTDKTGTRKTEWTLPDGETVTGADYGVITEEDRDGTAVVYNNHGTFKVILRQPDEPKLSLERVVLQKKTNGEWTDVASHWLEAVGSTGMIYSEVTETFSIERGENIDLNGEYRARLMLTAEDKSLVLVPDDQQISVLNHSGLTYQAEDGIPCLLTYDDSRNPQFEQIITLKGRTSLKATVYWLDAENRDHIRPDKVTVELLTSQESVNADGKTVTEWVPVTDANGAPVTAEVSDWKTSNGRGYADIKFSLDTFESRKYRIRVKTDAREETLVRFEDKHSLYREEYSDSNTAPRLTLTAQKEYSVEKKWDVDLEGLDIPNSLTVILQKEGKDGSWGEPLQALSLTADDEWKASFSPVNRYNYTVSNSSYTWDGEANYRVRECGIAPLKGKMAELLKGMEESAIKELNLPEFITTFLKGLLPDNGKVEKQVYDWICDQTKETPIGSQIRKLLKDSVIENGKYITLDISSYFSPLSGKTVEAHQTKYKASYATNGNKTIITNLAVEDFTIWKLWLLIDEEDRPDSVYLMLTSRPDSAFADTASSLGIPLVSDFTPVLNPIEGKQISILGWKIPLALGKVNKTLGANPVWNTRYVVKKYGELGIPQEFKGVELSSYIVSEAAKLFFGEFLGNFADILDYAGINFLDEYLSISTPAMRMPELVAAIGQSLGFDQLTGMHSAVVNTWIHGTPSIGGRKIWKDENDADGLRPDSVTIHIYEKNGFLKGDEIGTAKASALTFWTWTYSDECLDDDAEYIIEEEPVEGYTTTYDGYDIINTHVPARRETCNVTVVKQWNIVPEKLNSLTVYLKDEEGVVAQADLTPPEWHYTFTGLDVKDGNGKKIAYSVIEDSVQGYCLDSVEFHETADTDADGTAVTNYTFTLKNVSTVEPDALFKVTKIWQNDTAETRPNEVQMRLTSADGTVDKTLVLTSTENWVASVAVPLRDANNQLMTYTVEELSQINGYDSFVGTILSKLDGNTTVYECTVTNTYGGKPEDLVVRFILNKVWKDVPDNLIPDSVTCTIVGDDGTESGAVLTADSWSTVINNLPYADENGREITWHVEEDAVKGFLSDVGPIISETSGNTVTYRCTVTNTVDPIPYSSRCNFVVEKKWEDGLTDDKRPETLVWTLTGSNGTARIAHVTAEDGWKHTFWGLDYTDKDDTRITYTLSEDVPEHYACQIGEVTSSSDGEIVTYHCTVTNTLLENTAQFTVIKEWENDTYLNRPASLTVHLLADGAVLATSTLTEEKGWSYTWTGLPIRNADGREIVYTVEENTIPGYSLTVGQVEKRLDPDGCILYSCTLTNNLVQEDDPMTIRIVKIWSDTDAEARPETLSMTLSAGSISKGVVLDGSETDLDGNWTKTLYSMPRTGESGAVLNWTLTETVPVGYACDIRKSTVSDSGIIFTVTNTTVNAETELLIIKEWEDEGHEELRPDSIPLRILRNGEDSGSTVTLQSGNGWKAFVSDVPLYDASGAPYVYTLQEPDLGDRYRFSQHFVRLGDTLSLTAKNVLLFAGEEAILRVSKVWNEWDGEEKDHEPITILLRQNGNPWEYKTLSPNATGEWTAEWRVPFRDDDGNIIVYSVTEEVPDGYICKVSPLETDSSTDITVYSCVVTNTELPPETYFTVTYALYGDEKYGIPSGLTAPVDSKYYQIGSTVTVAPKQTTDWTTSDGTASGVKGNWTFTGWTRKAGPLMADAGGSSEDTFVITADTVLEGRWKFTPKEDPYEYKFVFHKEWNDNTDSHETPSFILYHSDGTVARGVSTRPKKTGEDEYTYWLPNEDDYYVIERPMEGYRTSYRNPAPHSDDNTRTYNGGTVINTAEGNVPQTGDKAPLIPALLLLFLSTVSGLLLRKKSRKHV